MHSQFVTVLVTIGGIIPVVGLALWVLRRMHSGLVKAVSEGVAAQLHPVQKELTPNGGSSMKDQMNILVTDMAALRREQRKQAADIKRVKGRVEQLEAR